MSDRDVEIVRWLFQTVEERDLETMFELYDPEVVIREAPSLPYGVRWHQKATAPNGEHVDLPAISEYCLRGGKIVTSAMQHFDTAAILRFLERAAAGPSPRR